MEFDRWFEVAGGSVTGTAHGRAGRNNQDAWAVRSGPEGGVAIVADGCGSGESSEVGARLGAALLAEGLLRRLRGTDPALPFGEPEAAALLEGARQDLLAHLGRLALDLSRQDHQLPTGPKTPEQGPLRTPPAPDLTEAPGAGPATLRPAPSPEEGFAAMRVPFPAPLDQPAPALAGGEARPMVARSGEPPAGQMPGGLLAIGETKDPKFPAWRNGDPADGASVGTTRGTRHRDQPPAPGALRGTDLAVPVGDFFLFTVVGFLATRTMAVAFHAGDGVLAWNGGITVWQALRNAPAYPAYELTGSSLQGLQPDAFRFTIDRSLPLDRLDSVLLGTDGLTDLMEAAGEAFPGTTEPIGPLSRFWEDDTLFTNPDALRRRLFRANQSHQRADWDGRRLHRTPGRLPDDTTLVVIRRRREGQA